MKGFPGQGNRVWSKRRPQQGKHPSFPRKRESSGPEIAPIVVDEASYPLPDDTDRKCGDPGFQLSRE